MEPYLTVAIPTMKRWNFLKDNLDIYLNRPEVGEVILCDETGEDVNTIGRSKYRHNPKLRLIINDTILGIYRNKVQCMKRARFPWIALLDSDDYFMDDWFDKIKKVLVKDNPKQIYTSASFITSNIDTRATVMPDSSFVDYRINNLNWNSIIKLRSWNMLFHGNWVLSKEAYEVLDPTKRRLEGVESLYMLREFIRNGYEIWYVPGLRYIHTTYSNKPIVSSPISWSIE
jgi:glycosyltransferase involved in cell wall biosynthesis